MSTSLASVPCFVARHSPPNGIPQRLSGLGGHRHANIFVNVGDATAADLCTLIEHVQEVVERDTGYRLETEIDFVGEFAPPTDAVLGYVEQDPDLVTAAERAKRRA